MALAEKLHHTSRGQRFARAGEEGREEHYALRRQRPPPPKPELFQLHEEEPGGSRPACLVAPRGPQEAVQRHTVVEQLADVVPMVQVLDAPGLLGEVGVVDFFRELDAPALDELVIAVPKFYLSRIPKRCPRRRPRRAEQLVEVPTIISYSSLQQRIAEQLIDIPVPHDRGGRGGGGGLQGFSQGQGATAFRGAEFVDIPVPQGRGGWVGLGGLQGFSQGQNSTADMEQIVDIPARGGPQGFLPGQSSSSSSRLLDNADEGIQGGFRTFSLPEKSATLGPHSGSVLSADFTPSAPATYVVSVGPPTWIDGAGLTWWQSASGRWYLDRDPSIWWDAPG